MLSVMGDPLSRTRIGNQRTESQHQAIYVILPWQTYLLFIGEVQQLVVSSVSNANTDHEDLSECTRADFLVLVNDWNRSERNVGIVSCFSKWPTGTVRQPRDLALFLRLYRARTCG